MKRDVTLNIRDKILGMKIYMKYLIDEYNGGNQNGLVQNIEHATPTIG